MKEALALLALAASLAVAVARPRWAPEWLVCAVAAGVLVALGVLSPHQAARAMRRLGATVGFLAALLVLADGCRRAGLFEALGAWMTRGAHARARRLLGLVFAGAAATTSVLGLDATIVLLTPVVFATAARLRTSSRPHVYACTHLANSASLLLPVSNLTNLLAFHDSGLSFSRFTALMVLPWAAALAIEWVALTRHFADELPEAPPDLPAERAAEDPRVPAYPLAVVGLTLVGFALSSLLGVAPVWFAAAGALALLAVGRPSLRRLVGALEPSFLVFVLALGVVVQAAGEHGLSGLIRGVLPHGQALPALLAVAGISAAVANLVNNLPATLIILPVAAGAGPGAVLAMLVGVNVGPNLTYVGSLATLLWRRILTAHEQEASLSEFTRLGVLTVPLILVASTAGLWLALRVL